MISCICSDPVLSKLDLYSGERLDFTLRLLLHALEITVDLFFPHQIIFVMDDSALYVLSTQAGSRVTFTVR